MGETVVILGDRRVLARATSVGQNEYFAAEAINLNPERVFKVRTCEYKGENRLTHRGKVLSIYRIFSEGGFTWLYTARKEGVF